MTQFPDQNKNKKEFLTTSRLRLSYKMKGELVKFQLTLQVNLGQTEGLQLMFYFFSLIYLFLAVLGLRCCCSRAFSNCGKRGLLFVFVVVPGLLVAVTCCGARAPGTWASVVAARGLSSCGSRTLEHRLGSCGARA